MLLTVGSDTLIPLVAHHVLCAGAFVAILAAAPEGITHACLLQLSESTVPFQFLVWLIEQRTHNRKDDRGYGYCLARWMQLVAWLMMRIALFFAFAVKVAYDWPDYTLLPRLLAVTMGPALLLFNLGGLVKVVMPGWPWRPAKVERKRR